MSATPDEPVLQIDDGFAEIVVAAELSEQGGGGQHPADGRDAEEADALDLYRQGLVAAAGFLLLLNLGFALLQVGSHPSEADASSLSLLVRAVVDGSVLAAVWLLPTLRRRGLRALELVLFGLEMLVLLDSQYFTGIHLIDQSDLVDAVAFQKNGVLRAMVLMFCSAVFMPHRPMIAGRIAVSMAGAVVLCHGFVLEHARTAHLVMDDVASQRVVMFNAVALVAAAVLAALVGWVLRGRKDSIMPGGRLGPYRLQLRLDTGGMGEVYLAQHHTLTRPCAVKVVRADRQQEAIDRQLLARELKAASALRHPSAVTIYDCGEASDGSPYFAMEFLPGLSLAGLVGRFGPMPAGRAIYLGRQLCGVLDEAHRRGLIHRDLSPSNVFACVLGGQCDVAKLLDFGVVAVTGEATDLAASGRVAGTPEYLAPEQAVRGGAIDGRADVYGLGGLLVFLLTGRPPYEGETPQAVLEMQVSEPLETVESLLQEVPDDLKAVILRCLAKQPDERFPTADAVAAALRSCQAATTWDAEEAVGWWRAHIDG